jgi:hypothetical protein
LGAFAAGLCATAGATVTFIVVLTVPSSAVIVAVPAFFGINVPSWATEATDEALDVHCALSSWLSLA